jgi:hypothetical protein
MRRFDQSSVASPAVGSDFNFTVSSTDSFKLLSLRAVLTIGVGVGGEIPHLIFKTPSGEKFIELVPVYVGVASAVVTYTWQDHSGGASIAGENYDGVVGLALPDWSVPANTVIESVTTALAAGDAWSDIYYTALVGDERDHLKWLESIAGSVGNLDMQ